MRSSANRSYNSNNGVPSGFMGPYAGNAVPAGWLKCDGSAISRSVYSGLFAAIGTLYGVGDGATTFNLPDSRGRAIVPAGGGYVAAATGGSETTAGVAAHTHTQPTHTHTAPAHTHTGGAHTHAVVDHTHAGPAHTHTIPDHTHGLPLNNLGAVPVAGGTAMVGASAGYTTDPGGAGNTGSSGTGATGAGGAQNTTSAGAVATTSDGALATTASGGDVTGSTGTATVDIKNPYLCVPSAIIKY